MRTSDDLSTYLADILDRTYNCADRITKIDTQLELALRLGYVTKTDYDRRYILLDGCLALTYGLRKSLRTQRRNR